MFRNLVHFLSALLFAIAAVFPVMSAAKGSPQQIQSISEACGVISGSQGNYKFSQRSREHGLVEIKLAPSNDRTQFQLSVLAPQSSYRCVSGKIIRDQNGRTLKVTRIWVKKGRSGFGVTIEPD